MAEAFRNAQLKIQRAKEHISDINRLVESFLDLDFYSVTIQVDTESGTNSLFVRIKETIPDDIALVIGDAIHNLRAALDLAVSEIVARAGGRVSDAYFPFNRDREGLQNSSKYGLINKSAPKAARLIADTIQPYETGDRALWCLHQMDILDKHRLIIPTAQVSEITILEAEDDRQNTIRGLTVRLSGAGGIVPFRTSGKLQVKRYGKPKIAILFGPETPVSGQKVLETVVMWTVSVERIIQTFRKAGLGGG